MRKFLFLITVALFCLASCRQDNKSTVATPTIDYTQVQHPQFNTDSAYAYLQTQLQFGYRVPGSRAQKECADYLAGMLSRWCDTVIQQPFNTKLWDGTTVQGRNIIASLNPQNDRRILLGAHWDSRMWADHDPDPDNHRKPIPGANDGASGVATLMEIARVVASQRPDVGIDIILFDVEDQGIPDWADEYKDNTWCLGSQYWAQHPHTPFYTAQYGILLDMVGSQQPRFTKEEVSRNYAPGLTNKIWQVAAALGHGKIFVDQNTDPILDDHMYVNQMAKIPMVDIVQNSPHCSFVETWHTLSDDLEHIDPNSLKVVADVVLTLLYAENPVQK